MEVATEAKDLNAYFDYSSVQETDDLSKLSKGRITKCNEQNFPLRLHYMLGELEKDGSDHVMSWLPHGRAFIVHDQGALARDLLPRWFQQNKYTSFQRQLNIYGFRRLTSGPEGSRGAYWHPLFLRGKFFLAQYIPRLKIKGKGYRKASEPESEPDFWRMPFLPLNPSRAVAEAPPSSASAAALAMPSVAMSGHVVPDPCQSSWGFPRPPPLYHHPLWSDPQKIQLVRTLIWDAGFQQASNPAPALCGVFDQLFLTEKTE
jgi:hypothetical protein